MRLKPEAARRGWSILLLTLAGLSAAPAFAQEPASVRPRTGPEAAPPPLPSFSRPSAPIVPPLPEAEPAQPAADAARVRAVEIIAEREGRQSLPPRRWRPPVEAASGLRLDHRSGEPLDASWVRRQFALNEIQGGPADRAVALVQLVNRAFLTAGFINSGLLVAAEAGAESGIFRLRLIHGRLVAPAPDGRPVEVVWANGRNGGLSERYVRARMPSAGAQPLSAVAIERDFRRLADDPAIRTVNAQLVPGAAPGEASLLLSVQPRERADLYISAANSRSPSVGGERAAIGGLVRNLVSSGDLLGGEFGITRGVIDGGASYATPFLGRRTTLFARGNFNRAAVVDRPLVPLDIRARDVGAEASLVRRIVDRPLMPMAENRWSPSQQLSLGLSLGWRRQRSFLLGQPFSFAPGSVDGRAEYGAVRFVADYVLRNVDQVFAASATATMGLWGTRSDQPLVLNPDRHFRALLVQLNYARRLDRHGLELRARLTGQAANSILYSGERLAIGGAASVRGYRETLLLADRGLIGSVELARPFSLSGEGAARRGWDWGAFTAGIFADAALADNVEGPDPAPDAIAGVGLMLAWQPSDAISLRLDYGRALVDADQTGSRNLQDRGVHFRLVLHPLGLFARR